MCTMEVEASFKFSYALIAIVIYFCCKVGLWRNDKFTIGDVLFDIYPMDNEADVYKVKQLAIEQLLDETASVIHTILLGYALTLSSILTVFSKENHIPTTSWFMLSGVVLFGYMVWLSVMKARKIEDKCTRLRYEIVDGIYDKLE